MRKIIFFIAFTFAVFHSYSAECLYVQNMVHENFGTPKYRQFRGRNYCDVMAGIYMGRMFRKEWDETKQKENIRWEADLYNKGQKYYSKKIKHSHKVYREKLKRAYELVGDNLYYLLGYVSSAKEKLWIVEFNEHHIGLDKSMINIPTPIIGTKKQIGEAEDLRLLF